MTGAVKEIIELINSSDTRVNQLSAVLTKEPLLMKSILYKVNALVYGLHQQVHDLNLAIVLLGFDVLRKTVASAIIYDTIRKMVNVLSLYNEFWNHSISTGFIAGMIAVKTKKCDSGDAFAAGLLHDIGHLVKQMTLTTISKPVNKHFPIVMSTDHEELGMSIAKKWNLSEEIVEAIRFHHHPEMATQSPELTAIVHVADVLSAELSGAKRSDEQGSVFHSQACITLGLTNEIILDPQHGAVLHSIRNNVKEYLGGDLIEIVKSVVVEVLSQLPEEEKIIFALHYYDNLSFQEIGRLCGYEEKMAQAFHEKTMNRLKQMFIPES